MIDAVAQGIVDSLQTAQGIGGVFDLAFPSVRVTMWSVRLGAWVWLASTKVGQPPAGVVEITPDDVRRMRALIADGWDVSTAIYRTLGVRPLA